MSAVDVDAGDTLAYSVPDGSGYRIINGNQLALAADKKLDLEDASVRGAYAARSVTVTVTDGGGLSTTLPITVTPTNVNESPTNLALSNSTCAEESLGATVGTLSSADVDIGDTKAYSVPAGSGYRIVTGNQLALAADKKLDFEDAAVRGAYASRSVVVTVTDGGGLTATLNVTVMPIPVNEPPFNLTIAQVQPPEETLGASVGTLSAQDPDAGDSLTFSVAAGSGYRIIGGSTLALAADRMLDREDATVRGVYAPRSVTVTVTDGGGLSTASVITVTPADVDESPSVPVNGTAGADGLVVENATSGTLVGVTMHSTDPEGRPVTFALTDDAGGRFAIDVGTGVVTAIGSLDYETATRHVLTVRASDGTLTSSSQITVLIADRDEAITAPVWNGVRTVTLVDASHALAMLPSSWLDPDGVPTPTLPATRVNGWQVAVQATANFSTRNDAWTVITGATSLTQATAQRTTGPWQVRRPDGTNLATITVNGTLETVLFTADPAVLLSAGEISGCLARLAFSTSGTQDLEVRADLTFSCAITPPQGAANADGRTLLGTVKLRNANQRPTLTLTGVEVDGSFPVARPGSIDLTAAELVIGDDHPEAGYVLEIVYPPAAGTLSTVTAGVATPLRAGAFLDIAGSAASTFTLRYQTSPAAAATSDTWVVRLIDRGIDGSQPDTFLASELVAIRVTITDSGGYRPLGLPATITYHEGDAPVVLAESATLGINGLVEDDAVLAGAWRLAIGTGTSDPLAASSDDQQELSLKRGNGLVDAPLVNASATIQVDGQTVATGDGVYDGLGGRALAFDLVPGATRAQLIRLVASLAYRTADRAIPLAGSPQTLVIGFIARTGTTPPPVTVEVNRLGRADPPEFAPAQVTLRAPRGAILRGSSVVVDPDGASFVAVRSDRSTLHPGDLPAGTFVAAEHTWHQVVPWVLEVPPTADGGSTWSLTIQDDTGLVATQTLNVVAIEGESQIQFISDAPMFQRLGERRSWRLRTAGSTAPVFLFDQGNLPAELAGLFSIDNAAGTLDLDLTHANVPSGTLVSGTVIANGPDQAGIQPIRLVIGARLSGSN